MQTRQDSFLALSNGMSRVTLINGRLCRDGELVEAHLAFSPDTGLIVEDDGTASGQTIDLQGAIVSPGFLEVQTNGLRGFHFTTFNGSADYASKLEDVAQYLPSQGVTGFYPTLPTISSDKFQQIIPSLEPRAIAKGASVLGAHLEGPYLHPLKKGCHDPALFHQATTPRSEVYGPSASSSAIVKIVTLAPELDGSLDLIRDLTSRGTKVSLGHSTATFEQGVAAVRAGATLLTHTLNAMPPLHHRDPGLAGLVAAAPALLPAPPFYSIIPDGNHLHPAIATLLLRANPRRCLLTTDSIELSGCPDGTYPGHAQIPHEQTKIGTRVVIAGTDTLTGGCATLQDCVQNVVRWSGCSVAEAVRCVTENVVAFTGDETRGVLEPGRRADLVVLDEEAGVLKTFVAGELVFEKK